MAAKSTTGGAGGEEHRVQIMSSDDASRIQGKGTKPEKQLNCFVRSVVLIERLGNALGTLAFTWATVILLGGYPTVLREKDDFWFATVIVFLEAARMFSKNNRTDYHVFFHTKGAVRPLGWNGLIVVVYLTSIVSYLFMLVFSSSVDLPVSCLRLMVLLVLVVPTISGIVRSSRAPQLFPKPVRDAVSLLGPVVATLLLLPLILSKFTHRTSMPMWMLLFTLVFLVVLLLTVNRLRFQPTHHSSKKSAATKHVLVVNQHRFRHRVVLNMCMFVELVMLVFMPRAQGIQAVMFWYEVLALVLVSFGNLQIPAAILRVVLSLLRLIPHDYNFSGEDGDDPKDSDKANLTPSLNIFYAMVLGQGTLYLAACLLGIFSFIPRRSLARRGGFRGRKGMELVDLYYAYTWDKCVESDVLARKKISLCSFALDSVNSDRSPARQLLGVQLAHRLLKTEPARTRLLSRLDASAETVARVVRMLDRTSPEDTGVRLFAAKVVAELAKSLRVAAVPGMVQLVSALLDADRKPKRESSALLDTDDDDEQEEAAVAGNIKDEKHDFIMGELYWDGDASKVHEPEACSNKDDQQASSCLLRCWNWISRAWSTSPDEEPPTDHSNNNNQLLLPELGMSILNSLAHRDSDNRAEISRAPDLIHKIIEFTHHQSFTGTANNEAQQHKVSLLRSSLKLLRRLSSTGGETGVALRRKMSEHPVLLRNLAEVLGDDTAVELRKLAAETLRNLAVDGSTSREIGRARAVVARLVDAFRGRQDGGKLVSSTESKQATLQKVAGQALAMLTMESAGNCTAVAVEYTDFIEGLTGMICRNKHRYVAARLLRNLLVHTQVDFISSSESRQLCEATGKVLETIMDPETDGAELEALIGLTSQISRVVPGGFARELGEKREPFVRKLVATLAKTTSPAVDCPGLRRAAIEQAVHLMTRCGGGSDGYAALFRRCGMKEALVTVEETPARVERFRVFVGSAGLMEHAEPIAGLVAAAKQLMR